MIKVEGLGKRYRLGDLKPWNGSLSDSFSAGVSRAWTRFGTSARKQTREEIWALRDVSLEIASGEVIGIVGRNGSGKTTLLKILAGVTTPTEGTATLRGRVGSLLGVGTGFHPELTGRDNVFLSGAILGMRGAEIAAKLDAIVAFAEVEAFLETPVKRYSSGMYLRLAFSVAAHLETEILLVDEVLAVGDTAFQRKCFEKMEDLAASGRTVVVVSHDLGALERLCRSGIVLHRGKLVAVTSMSDAVGLYGEILSEMEAQGPEAESGGISVSPVRVEGDSLNTGDPVRLSFTLRVSGAYSRLYVQLGLVSFGGQNLMVEGLSSKEHSELLTPGEHTIVMETPPLWLMPRSYSTRIKVLADPEDGSQARFTSDWSLIVVSGGEIGCSHPSSVLAPEVTWSIRSLSEGTVDGGRDG